MSDNPHARREGETELDHIVRLVREDPGIPVSLLVHRASGGKHLSARAHRAFWHNIGLLVERGIISEVVEGIEGARPVSRRLWINEEYT